MKLEIAPYLECRDSKLREDIWEAVKRGIYWSVGRTEICENNKKKF